MQLEPALDIRGPDTARQLGFLGHDVAYETLKPFFKVVVNFHLLGIGDGKNLDFVREPTRPVQLIINEAEEGLVDLVLRLDEQKNPAGESVDLKNQALQQITVY